MGSVRLTGWRYGMLIGGLVGGIALVMYPIAVMPYMDSSQWSKLLSVHHHLK